MAGWNHKLTPYTPEELRAWEEHERRCNERWPEGPRRGEFWSSCSAPLCEGRPLYQATYDYVTGRAGRVSFARKEYCEKHAQGYAAKHGLELVPSAVQPADGPPGPERTGD